MPEGSFPLVSVEGTAYECGREYGEIVLRKYPGFDLYLNDVPGWKRQSPLVKTLFEKKASYVLDIYRGLQSALDRRKGVTKKSDRIRGACTSFSISPELTLDKMPISGQNKDTDINRLSRYGIVLRMRIKKAHTILVLAYPGEVLGYGMWSNGMTIFRNTLYSRENAGGKLNMVEWGLLALAGGSVYEAQELAAKYGILGSGNCLISDAHGNSLSVEFNMSGADFIRPTKGILAHANHPVGKKTALFEDYPGRVEKKDSRYRSSCLWKLLNAERGRLTAQRALMCLADHSHYPRGLCRHKIGERTDLLTTASVVAESGKGLLHVVKGSPCANWPVTYSI